MTEKQIKNLSEYLQKKIHEDHLPGYYFSPEDIECYIREFIQKKSKSFEVGGKVSHLIYGEGVIIEDVSNEFTEAYKVKYADKTSVSSGSLLSKIIER